MYVSNPKKEEPKKTPYTYVNGIGFLPETHDDLRKSLNLLLAELCIALLFYLILRQLLLMPSYYFSALLKTGVQKNPMTGLMLMTPSAIQTANLFCYLGSILLPLLFLALIHHKELHPMALFTVPSFKYAVNSLCLLCGSGVTGLLLADFFTDCLSKNGLVLETETFTPPSIPRAFYLYLAVSILLPAILEEFLYRGLILHLLRRFDDTFAVLVSALLFALMQSSVYEMIYAFLFALALGYIALKNGGLLVCMGASFLMRLLRLCNWMLQNQGTGFLSSTLPYLTTAFFLILGIICFIQRVNFNPHAFEMKKDECVLTNREKFKTLALNPLFWILTIAAIYSFCHSFQFIN